MEINFSIHFNFRFDRSLSVVSYSEQFEISCTIIIYQNQILSPQLFQLLCESFIIILNKRDIDKLTVVVIAQMLQYRILKLHGWGICMIDTQKVNGLRQQLKKSEIF